MIKHTQTIRLSVFDHFVGLALKGLIILTRFCKKFHFASLHMISKSNYVCSCNTTASIERNKKTPKITYKAFYNEQFHNHKNLVLQNQSDWRKWLRGKTSEQVHLEKDISVNKWLLGCLNQTCCNELH